MAVGLWLARSGEGVRMFVLAAARKKILAGPKKSKIYNFATLLL